MSAQLKYAAKIVFWDAINKRVLSKLQIEEYRVKGKLKLPDNIYRFDSTLEFRVYLELCRMYGANRILRQIPVEIFLPGYCYPKGKTWKIDFGICSQYGDLDIYYYVEAKGMWLSEFSSVLAALEKRDDCTFNRLRIVCGNGIPKTNRVVKALLKSDFHKNLLTLKQLAKLQQLP